ncbi:hypothetical protein [Streptosporangium sp. NPDC050280]|uniref:hypothetical protein n=1 Tax=unclassified Streptosporangium TaxID=2632669 RepID=UPI0034193CBC
MDTPDIHLRVLETDVAALRAQSQESKVINAGILDVLKDLRTVTTELWTEMTGFRTEMTGFRTELTGFRTELDKLRTGQDSLRAEMTELRTEVNELRTGQDPHRRRHPWPRVSAARLPCPHRITRPAPYPLRASRWISWNCRRSVG